MALSDDWQKTQYDGVYFKQDKEKGKVFVVRFKINGKQYKKVVGYENDIFRTTAKKASVERVKLIEEYKNGNIASDKKIKLSNFFDDYMEKKSLALATHTAKSYRSFFENHIRADIGELDIKKITQRDLQGVINKLLMDGKQPRTAKTLIEVLRPLFNYAIDCKLLVSNPATKLSMPKFDNRRYFDLPMDKAQKLYQVITTHESPFYRGFFTFLLHGRRLSEVIHLAWSDINIEAGYYAIRSENNKARKSMKYPLTPLLLECLENLEREFELVFANPQTGKPITNPKKQWAKILEASEIDDMRLHDLRHLIGFIAVNNGESLEAIGKTLGHLNSNTTARYSNVQVATAAGVIERVFDKLKK